MERMIIVEKPLEKPEIISSEEEVTHNTESLGIVFPKGVLFDADVIPDSIATATLHVFSARLDGDYITNVKNTGMLMLMRPSLTHSLRESSRGIDLFRGVTHSLGFLARGGTAPVRHGWRVTGVLAVLWALITIFFTGKARVTEEANVTALGFSKTFRKDVWVPVRNVRVAWD